MKNDNAEKVAATVDILEYAFSGRLAPDDPERLPYVILLAWHGWENAHRALCAYARRLTDQQKPLPDGLQTYIVFAASGGFRRKKRFKNAERDLAIAVAISELVDAGYSPTRNAATEAPSACSLLSDALKGFKINLTERGVEQIWQRMGKGLLKEFDSSH